MNKKFILLSSALLISACQQNGQLCQEYTGILPAADAAGIETTLSFKSTGRYHNKQIYLNNENTVFEEDGNYIITDTTIALSEPNGTTAYYRIENKQIRRLNNDQQEITGPLAEYYVLKCKNK